MEHNFAIAVVVAFGLVYGSFLNVLIHRLPRHEPIAGQPSHCPVCLAPIPWYRNLPVFSYLALRGSCASCGARISPRYLLVEVLAAVVLLGTFLRMPESDPVTLVGTLTVAPFLVVLAWLGVKMVPSGWRIPFSEVAPGVVVGGTVAAVAFVLLTRLAPVDFRAPALFALGMVVLFFTDLEHRLLPDVITVGGSVFGLAIAPWNPRIALHHTTANGAWFEALAGAAFGFGLLWSIAAAYRRFRKIDGLGGGDVKLAALIGAFAGAKGVVAVILLASFAGVIFGLVLILMRRADFQSALPFGCFLAPIAALVVVGGYDSLWPMWEAMVLRTVYGIELFP